MGTITIINTTPYNLQPVPEPGKEYHIFDDGKISPSRHYIAKIVEVIPFEEIDTAILDAWKNEKSFCDWLYATETDCFVKAISNFDDEPLHFVRTVDGGWFSINYPDGWMGARLDIDGKLYNRMIENFTER